MTPTRHSITLGLISAIIFISTSNGNKSEFSSILIFGDSTVDTGNNDYIKDVLLVKGNHYPYGRDFPGHIATGRFSNGKLVPDFLASMLNIKDTVPPFLDPHLTDDDLLTGVSFASAGSGFDNLTLSLFHVIPVSKQPDYFRTYAKRLKKIAGDEEAEKRLRDALVFISAGTNDVTISFYDIPTRSLEFKFNISMYQDYLLNSLQTIIEELYELGLRRMVVVGLPPVGCIPFQMTLKFENPKHRKCVENQNSDAKLYNLKLEKLLPQIQAVLPGSRLVYADIYSPVFDMIKYPTKYGFEVTKRGCCGSGLLAVGPLCNILTPTCDDASKYLFWDSFHPTEAASKYLAQYLEQQVVPKFWYKLNFSSEA